MAEFPVFPFFTDAYLGDTTHLTTIEHGAYLLLLITEWRSKDGTLPDNDVLLARFTRLTEGQWLRIRPVLEPFFDISNGVWTQGRLLDELTYVRENSRRQSKNSRARWQRNSEKSTDPVRREHIGPSDRSKAKPLKSKNSGHATGMPLASHSDPPTPTPTPSSLELNQPMRSIPARESGRSVKKFDMSKWQSRPVKTIEEYKASWPAYMPPLEQKTIDEMYPYGDFRFQPGMTQADLPENYNPLDDPSNSRYDPIRFCGKTIRLRKSDFEKWRKLYSGNDDQFWDLLVNREKFYAEKCAPERRKNWFISTEKYIRSLP